MEFLIRLPFGLNIIYGIILYMLKKIILFSSLSAFVILLIILNITTPSRVGPIGILAVFIMLYAIFLGFISFLIYGFLKILILLKQKKENASSDIKVFKKAYYYSTVIAFAPVVMIAQQSIGGVGFFEFFLILIFEIIACIYVSKR